MASVAPTAMPTSAAESAARSLMPSPQNSVVLPRPCSDSIDTDDGVTVSDDCVTLVANTVSRSLMPFPKSSAVLTRPCNDNTYGYSTVSNNHNSCDDTHSSNGSLC